MLFVCLICRHDIDLPAGQLRGETHILTAATDRHGELLFRNHHISALVVFVQNDGLNFSRLQSLKHVEGRILVPEHDINMLVGKFGGHRVHAAAVDTDAGSDRVNAGVVSKHSHLGAKAGVAGDALDLEETLFDFGNFKLEQLLQEVRARAGKNDLLATLAVFDTQHVSLHTVPRMNIFARDHLITREAGIKTAEFNDRVALIHTLHLSAHDRFAAVQELLHDLSALSIAEALQDDLLRILSKTAGVRVSRSHRADDVIALGEIRVVIMNVAVHFLAVRLLQTLIVRNNQPAALSGIVARFAVDMHHHIRILARESRALDCRGESHFHNAKHNVDVNALLVGKNLDHIKKIFAAHRFIHLRPPLKSSSAIKCACSTSERGNSTVMGAACS